MQRSSTTATGGGALVKLEPIAPSRANSAQANLQSHPCFQSSLFNDKERAAGSLKIWKERYFNERSLTMIDGGLEAKKKNLNKDYQLENVIWSQSVIKHLILAIGNSIPSYC
jgi:hypothetical protein